MQDLFQVKDILAQRFTGDDKIVTVVAPGRVNLIGEHTDYNDGFVLPMAIDMQTSVAARLRNDNLIRIYSVAFNETISFSLDRMGKKQNPPWSNIPRGILWALICEGIKLRGCDLVIGTGVPVGAGLSSSAAVEVGISTAILSLINFAMAPARLAKICQRAENDFVGTQCGIMDQFIIAAGKKGQALYLDCRSLDFQHIPLMLGDYRFVICHSGVKRSLVTAGYNERRFECEQGTHILQKRLKNILALRDVSIEQLEKYQSEMPEHIYRRCRHVINENNLVQQSVAALRVGNLHRFGELMIASHYSQRDNFEVSCAEVDLLVDLALGIKGVLGARLTGGGFGGCTINLVASESVATFKHMVASEYERRTNIKPQFYTTSAAQGVHCLSMGDSGSFAEGARHH
ncbi:MAG: galactokinase [Deltaproteobacteria bacterium]|nr:galactokinase [Deltaproteobacteria bacterium]